MNTRGRINKEPYINWSRKNWPNINYYYNSGNNSQYGINTNQYRNPNANIAIQSNKNNYNNLLNSSSYNNKINKGGYKYNIQNANTQRKINELFVYFKYLCVVRAYQTNPNLVNSPDPFIKECLRIMFSNKINASYNISYVTGMLAPKPTQSQLTPSGVLNASFSQPSTGYMSWGWNNGNTATSRPR